MNNELDMTEQTLQFVIKLFASLAALVMVLVVITLAVIVVRDGNNPLVQSAFTDLTDIAGKLFLSLSGMIVIKPVVSAVVQRSLPVASPGQEPPSAI